MPIKLPPILNFRPPKQGPTDSIGRAQNFSTSKLNQLKERETATTSIGRAMKAKTEKDETSFSGRQASKKITSINRPADARDPDDIYRDEVRDRLRSKHIRELIKNKKEEKNSRDTLQ